VSEAEGFPRKRWVLRPPAPPELRAGAPDVHPVAVQLLYNRGLTTAIEIYTHLADRGAEYDPALLPDLPKAAARLAGAVRAGEPVGVYGDFDVDGLTGAAVLAEGVRLLQGRSAVFIPNRAEEGHGLNRRGLDELHAQGCRVVISADCGIGDTAAADYAKSLGIDLIVTDHHLIGAEMAPAYAAINPRRADSSYPYPNLAGVGVAYKLVRGLLAGFPEKRVDPEELLDLVAVGTVADVSHLGGENRTLVRKGLRVLTRTKRVGLKQLLGDGFNELHPASAEQVGYAIGPRLNAAGRMGDARAAYELLVARDPLEAARLIRELDRLNAERQRLTGQVMGQARAALARDGLAPLLVHTGEDLPAGIIGLVAGRLAEEHGRPAVVISLSGDDLRGSARSIPSVNIVEALESVAPRLTRYGGHAAAAGFSAPRDQLEAIRQGLQDYVDQRLDGLDLSPVLEIDQELRPDDFAYPTYRVLRDLAPFGSGNPHPLFLSRGLRVLEQRSVGAAGQHLRLRLHDGRKQVSAIAFGLGAEAGRLPDRLDLVYQLESESYKGTIGLQMRVLDLAASA
jgi:single-stranded-DNA-specific exonuclease